MRDKHGFTLIEAVVVVAVLGILLGIMIPGVMNYMSDAKKKECAVNRKAILLELDAARVLDPGCTLEAVIADCSDSICCPEQGVYTADRDTVRCSVHGEDSAFSEEIDTEVVIEPEDRPEPSVPVKPTEPVVPTEPTEPVAPTEPTEPTIPDIEVTVVEADLLRASLHPNEEVRQTITPHRLYRMEMLDGSSILCVSVNNSRWEGADWETPSSADVFEVDTQNVAAISDYFVKTKGDTLRCTVGFTAGKVFFDENTGKYYVYCGKSHITVNDETKLNSRSDWIPLESV